MTRSRIVATLSLVLGLMLSLSLGLNARLPGQPDADARVVAIGDVHGSLDGLVSILQAAGLIDAARHWTGGSATLVQTGDVTDRGAHVRGALDLLMALSTEARAAGGRVTPLLGNHEMMNLIGELRDVTPIICASFAAADSDATREAGWRTYAALASARSRTRPGEEPPALARTREGWLAAYAPGCIEYRLALAPQGTYGRWLRERPIAAKVGGAVFMHAGPDPAAPLASLDELNARARDEVRRFDRFHERLVRAKLAAPWFRLEDVLAVAAAEVRWTNGLVAGAKERGEALDLSGVDVDLVKEAAAVLGIGDWSLLNGDGPLWYRGYALDEEPALEAPLAALLKHWNADRLVVGHSVQRDALIHARLQGQLFLIDTGMLAPVYKGAASALELTGGRATAIYADGTRVVLHPVP